MLAQPPPIDLSDLRNRYVSASESPRLPIAVPESYICQVKEWTMKDCDMASLSGPIICLADCISPDPMGPVKILCQKLPHMAEYFLKRKQGAINQYFCAEDCRERLGSYTHVRSKVAHLPDVYLVHNAILHIDH